jgi:2'-5' RNA ligase
VEFDKFSFGKTENGNLIMVSAKHNEDLIKLQKTVLNKLRGFGTTIKPTYKEYETNFRPHIALARKLSDKIFIKAKKELEKQIYGKAIITKLALTVVSENYSVEDIVDPENTFNYFLKRKS